MCLLFDVTKQYNRHMYETFVWSHGECMKKPGIQIDQKNVVNRKYAFLNKEIQLKFAIW